jgi:hypothetical protein
MNTIHEYTKAEVAGNIDAMVQRIHPLRCVLERLGETAIRYGLYSGAHVGIITGSRVPVDVDLLVHDDDLTMLRETFPSAKTTDHSHGMRLYIGNDQAIEFIGRGNIIKDGASYPFRLSELALTRLTTYTTELTEIRVVDPVDTLVLKAVLRRSEDQGKHDLEDMAALIARVDIDESYLKARLDEVHAREMTRPTWRNFGIVV